MKISLLRSTFVLAIAAISAYSFGQTADPNQSYATFANGQGSLDGLTFTGVDFSLQISKNGMDLYAANTNAGAFTFTGSQSSFANLIAPQNSSFSVYVPLTVNAGTIDPGFLPLQFNGVIQAVDPTNFSKGIDIDFTTHYAAGQANFTYFPVSGNYGQYTLDADNITLRPPSGSPGTLVGNMNTELFKIEQPMTPEPSSIAAFSLLGVGFLLRRKRKTA